MYVQWIVFYLCRLCVVQSTILKDLYIFKKQILELYAKVDKLYLVQFK